MSTSLRVIFMGTPEFSVPALNAIIAAGHDVIAVYTRAPKPKGRGGNIEITPIHRIANEHGIPVFTPLSFRKYSEAAVEFAALKPDVAVVAAYGLILTPRCYRRPNMDVSIFMHHYYRGGGGRPHCTTPFWRATRLRASQSCKWRKG